MASPILSFIVFSVTVSLLRSTVASGDWQSNQGGKTQVPSSRVVNTRKGSIRGLYQAFEDKSLAAVELFLGVPYASPPIGSLRFMPPVTVSPWRGIRQADRYGPVCPQRFPDITNETEALKRMPRGRLETLKKMAPLLTNQSEDCLYLNIFTPYSSKSFRSILQNFFFFQCPIKFMSLHYKLKSPLNALLLFTTSASKKSYRFCYWESWLYFRIQ